MVANQIKEGSPMTVCSRTLSFSSVFNKVLSADFRGGNITSDAGALLLREADRQLKFTSRLAACISDPRDPDLIEHTVLDMVRQRVYGIALGYEDLNDFDTLRQDKLFQILAEKDGPLASPPTLCRFENRTSQLSLLRMSEYLVERFVESFNGRPEKLVLDFDATEDEIHGHQEKNFFHGYYDCYCYLPLYVFCGDKLLLSYLRPSNIDAALHAGPILKLLVKRLRAEWPGVQIILRGDSGFARKRILSWCERNKVDYIVGLARNTRLESLSQPLMNAAKKCFDETKEKQRLFAWIDYKAGTWKHARHVIAKAEYSNKGENPRYVVTTLSGDAQELYEQDYCARGEMENRIKEHQSELFGGRTSCHKFRANQLRLLLVSAAYVLMEYIRAHALKGTVLEQAQCHTMRLKLMKIGARIVTSVRRIVLHLSGGYPYTELLTIALARLSSA